MAGNQEVIGTLNELIQITRDGEQGFRTCAENVRNSNLQSQFQAASRRCGDGATELESQIRALGGQPALGGSISGAVQRAWTNIKSTISGMNEQAVLAEAERGENAARSAYEQALQQQNLPADVRNLIERQYQGVKENQERVRNLRSSTA
jgi:uncharacterized protein (TIGR02284 family)